MRVAGFVGAARLGLALAASVAVSGTLAAEAGLSGYQGAWLMQGPSCEDVYSSAGKGTSFKKPVDIFAPAFIVSGNRLRTPMASCRIKSVKPGFPRWIDAPFTLWVEIASCISSLRQPIRPNHGGCSG